MFCELDTETTGLVDDPCACVVEVGAVLVADNGAILDSFESLVRPDILTEDGQRICEEISGISAEEILAAPLPSDVFVALGRFLLGWSVPVWTYNLDFDQRMVRRTFCGADEVPDEEDPVQWGGCTMRMFGRRFRMTYGKLPQDGGDPNFPLWKAIDIAGFGFVGDAHRALTDARAAARLQWMMLAEGFGPPPPHPSNHAGRIRLGMRRGVR